MYWFFRYMSPWLFQPKYIHPVFLFYKIFIYSKRSICFPSFYFFIFGSKINAPR